MSKFRLFSHLQEARKTTLLKHSWFHGFCSGYGRILGNKCSRASRAAATDRRPAPDLSGAHRCAWRCRGGVRRRGWFHGRGDDRPAGTPQIENRRGYKSIPVLSGSCGARPEAEAAAMAAVRASERFGADTARLRAGGIETAEEGAAALALSGEGEHLGAGLSGGGMRG